MTNLVGRHLEEMADMRSTRKRRVVLLTSVVASCLFFFYAVVHFNNQSYQFGLLNIACVVAITINGLYLIKYPTNNHCDLILSGVLLFQGVVLLLYGETVASRLLWIYPILAAVVFLNDFKIGVIFSTSFCLIVGLAMLLPHTIALPPSFSVGRFLISLFALCLICNTSAYYYSKVVNYIQSLYQEGIEDLAYMDQLTGLANRWSFENWAAEKLIEKSNSSQITALVFLDIDDFKSINDTYGHDVGDRVLQHFASRLKNNIRNKDRKTDKHDYSIARFAGDEFVLLLYDVRTRKDLDAILERICGLFEQSYQSSQRINRLTVSVGAALFPNDATNLPELTRCADKAMYAAKHAGKNQYQYYHGEALNPLHEVNENSDSKVTPFIRN
ncbi:GGDEF domain-containing protein [Vibrio paucivorans]|uniref:GGDEF domain-containing protein n=1 Tax=Vibrio paucivorans TaxID=2829489 RepID=A0A9X3HR43_9VIBR|nr:GGDEF domain-containing protein [Vibrio paucivorans]MCW8333850.1 GGDEF domain-containing protein [Vibrio paucivorans]